MNVTVVSPSAPGYLTVYPTGTAGAERVEPELRRRTDGAQPGRGAPRGRPGGRHAEWWHRRPPVRRGRVVRLDLHPASREPARDAGAGPQARHPGAEPGPGVREGRARPDDRRAGRAGQPGHHRGGGEPDRHGHDGGDVRHGLPVERVEAQRVELEPRRRPDAAEPGDARRVAAGTDQAVQRRRQRRPDRRSGRDVHPGRSRRGAEGSPRAARQPAAHRRHTGDRRHSSARAAACTPSRPSRREVCRARSLAS